LPQLCQILQQHQKRVANEGSSDEASVSITASRASVDKRQQRQALPALPVLEHMLAGSGAPSAVSRSPPVKSVSNSRLHWAGGGVLVVPLIMPGADLTS
jgi:predicted component of type VI protein secretion system